MLGILPGGVLIDRFNRKKLRVLNAALLIAVQVVLIGLIVSHTANVWTLSILAIANNLRGSLLGFASDAMLKAVVAPSHLPSAMANNQGRDAAINLAGAPVGGVLLSLSLIGPAIVNSVGAIGVIFSSLMMRGDYRPREAGASTENPLKEIADSLRWVGRRSLVMWIFSALALVNFAVMSIMSTITLGLVALGNAPGIVGLAQTAIGLGTLVGALFASQVVRRVPTGALVPIVFPMLVVGYGLVALAEPNVWLVCGVSFFVALPLPTLNAGLSGFLVQLVPNEMMGRIQSTLALFSSGLAMFAPAVAGWGLAFMGWRGIMVSLVIVLIVAATLGVVSPGMRRIPRSDQWEECAAEVERAASA